MGRIKNKKDLFEYVEESLILRFITLINALYTIHLNPQKVQGLT